MVCYWHYSCGNDVAYECVGVGNESNQEIEAREDAEDVQEGDREETESTQLDPAVFNRGAGERQDNKDIDNDASSISATKLASKVATQPSDELSDSFLSEKLSKTENTLAFEVELRNSEKHGAFTPVDAKLLSRDPNIIGSHSIFKGKLDSKAKARTVSWGYRNKDKGFIRGDNPSVSLEGLRTVLSISTENEWHIGLMDMVSYYLQDPKFN